MKKILVIMMSLGILNACTTPSVSHSSDSMEPMMTKIPGQPQADIWFQGTVEEAFQKALSEKKLVFLYWGAVWCPPCNELKANVFSKPKFAELMKSFIPVYLDGDTEEAQSWGERLQTSGYPTVLVLDQDKKELFRLGSSINLAEFEDALQPLLGQSINFQFAVTELQKKNVSDASWKVLAYADWDQLPKEFGDKRQRALMLQQAVHLCPDKFSHEKSLLGTAYLAMTASLPEKDRLTARPEDKKLLQNLLSSPNRHSSVRNLVVNHTFSVTTWLYPRTDDPAYGETKQLWLALAHVIAQDPSLSVETRLNSVSPEIDFFRREDPKGKIPDSLKKKVQEVAARADKEAITDFERHAVISGAAYYLRQVGDYDGARDLLARELKRTDTPWYYQSSLSNLEAEAGRTDEARMWAAKARETAQGRATKVQWITNDILLNAKADQGLKPDYLRRLAREYYELATALSDGFSGRNKLRSLKVQEALAVLKEDPEFKTMIRQYVDRCQDLRADNKQACLDHFRAYPL
jgi:protein disulfide-isomerase